MHHSDLFEALETRRMLTADLVGGELTLVGTSGADNIFVEPGLNPGEVEVFGVDGVDDGMLFAGVDTVLMRLLGGPDFGDADAGLLDTLGNPMSATILGGPGADRLTGGDGDDIINGGGGTDTISGGLGNDVLKGNSGSDVIFGNEGDDRLVGGSGQDSLFGEEGDDRVLGNTQNDVLIGGDGNDRILGGNGLDQLDGGAGDDFMEGRRGNDILLGGDGNDLLKGLNGRDQLFGGNGDDELRGNAQADDLNGGAGNDLLLGGAGPDILFGGLGVDQLSGQGGADNFRGPFSERQDFRSGDEFFSQDAGNGEPFALLPDPVWDAIDNLESQSFGGPTFWSGIDGMQEILADCGEQLDGALTAFENLSDQEAQAVFAQVDPIVDSFLNDVGFNFANITAQRMLQFFGELQLVDLGPAQGPSNAYLACLANEEGALFQIANFTSELGQLGALDPFRDAISDFLLGLI